MTDKTPSTGTEMTDETIMSAPNVSDITDMTDDEIDALLEPAREVKPFDLRLHVHRLLIDEPFFAALSRRIDKRAGGVPTAGVRVTEEGKLEMRYNPDFFAPLSDETRKDILKHEFYHIVLQHVTGGRFRSFRDMSPADCRAHNIAMDLAINSHLDNLPEGCCKPGQEGPFKDLPAYKSAEWYLKNLPEPEGGEGEGQGEGEGEGQEGGTPGSGGGQGQGQGGGQPFEDGVFDDHSGWDDVDDATKQLAEERIKEFVREAVNEAQSSSRGWGTVPANMRKDILDSITSKLDWKKVLRYFVKQSQKANKRSTVRKINRRYPYQHPGKRSTRTAKVAIAIDQSGSVSDAMLEAFFGELNGLSKLAEFTVIPFDTRVDDSKVQVWKKGQSRKRERVMCGGTCFDAPTKWVNEKGGFDGLIILTDMEAPKPVACRVQRMWMTTEHYANRPYFDPKPERLVGIPLE
jgi:predicted metal-dependent peptidase